MSFYLVQRLEAAPEGRGRNPLGSNINVSKILQGAGAEVSLAYMGSSQFEGAAARKSGDRIADVAEKLKIVTQTVVRPSYEELVHFVCTPEQEKDLLPKWHEWSQNPRTLEPTGYFKDLDTDYMGPSNEDRIVGWWALGEDLIWSRTEEVAERIRGAFVRLVTSEA